MSGKGSVRFKPENRARYFMDFSGWEGLPSDRDFREFGAPKGHSSKDWHKLVAAGYGEVGNYGNGAIYISAEEIARWRQPGS